MVVVIEEELSEEEGCCFERKGNAGGRLRGEKQPKGKGATTTVLSDWVGQPSGLALLATEVLLQSSAVEKWSRAAHSCKLTHTHTHPHPHPHTKAGQIHTLILIRSDSCTL